VTLSGDVRPVPALAARIAEAVRLGHTRLLVPPGTAERLDARTREVAQLEEVSSLREAAARALPA